MRSADFWRQAVFLVGAGCLLVTVVAPSPAFSRETDIRPPLDVVIGALPAETAPDKPGSPVRPEQDRIAQAAGEFSVANASGAPGKPIPITIKATTAKGADYAFIMIRGLPAGFKLSAGLQTKDAWAVSLRDLPGLTLTAPETYDGPGLLLEVLLIRGRDAAPESRVLRVALSPEGTAAANAVGGSQIFTAAPPDAADAAALLKDDDSEDKTGLVSPPSGVPEAEEAVLMQRAAGLLKAGDISAARLLYEHLALRGSAKAAFSMGQTFDPDFLSSFFVKGLQPNVAKAREWYAKAAELGNPLAQERLSELGGR